jgi:tol-pal system beta propeller repeat protein TolB
MLGRKGHRYQIVFGNLHQKCLVLAGLVLALSLVHVQTPRQSITSRQSEMTLIPATLAATNNSTRSEGKIAFASFREGHSQIYVMDADGSHQRNLSNNQFADDEPAWSPDGKHIAFRSYRGGNFQIYVMDADGSHQTNLSNNEYRDEQPAWSPESKHIVFTSSRGNTPQIYVMGADGSRQTNLSNNGWYDEYPAWSPDGKHIVFSSLRDIDPYNQQIYVMDANGNNQRILVL